MNKGGIRGGTRGGKDQFDWEDVKTDKDRENYLGHSLKASVGRWQKGRDLTWYTKESKVAGRKEKLRAELVDLKRAEEEAMAAALGLKPPAPVNPQQSLSKQELAEVCRRRSTEETEGTEERVKGIGFQSRRAQAMFVGTKSSTTKEGATIFEHGSEVKDDGKLKMSKSSRLSESDIVSPTTTTAATPSKSTVYGPTVDDVPPPSQVQPSYGSSDYTPRKKKKKKDRVDSDQSVSPVRSRGDKKNKKRKKHHRKEEDWSEVSLSGRKEHKTSRKRKLSTSPRKRRRDSTSSDSDGEVWVDSGAKKARDHQRTSPHHKHHHKHHHHSHHKADRNR